MQTSPVSFLGTAWSRKNVPGGGPQNYTYRLLFKSWSFQSKSLQMNLEKIVPCKEADKFVVENKIFGTTFDINIKLLFLFIFRGNVSLPPTNYELNRLNSCTDDVV